MVRTALLSLLALLLIAGCGGGSSAPKPTSTQPLPPTNTPAATPTAAATAALTAQSATQPPASAADCSPARAHSSGSSRETITSGGRPREYLLEVPASYTGSDALPLVFNFHGYGSNAAQQAAYSGLPAKGNAVGFIVVTPQGSGDKPYWNSLGVRLLPDDVGFTTDMLNAVESQLCIDTSRVFATGISNGASMSVLLACDLSDRIAAIAGVSGVYFPKTCGATRAVPVLSFHGTADPIVPYNGGPINAGISQLLNLSAPPEEDAVRDWAQHNGCNLAPAVEQTTANVRHIVYSGCQQGANVELYSINGGGHTWPGAAIDAAPAVLGPTTHEISATDLIWDFFVAHPMP